MKVYWVYILASKPNGILYTGFTGDLIGCIYKNKQKLSDGFAKNVTLISWYIWKGFMISMRRFIEKNVLKDEEEHTK
jgi:predicted GIY-YIG superfamily endonuclease